MSFLDFANSYQPDKEKPEQADELASTFPIDAFPQEVASMIQAFCDSVKDIPDHFGTNVLGAVSAAVGKTVRVATTREPVPMALWTCTIDDSGAGKSAAFGLGFKAVQQKNEESNRQFQAKREELEQEIFKLKGELIGAREQQEKENLKLTIADLENKLNNLREVFYTIDDITYEQIGRALESNERGVSLLTDEMATWFLGFGKYQKSGVGSEDANWIKLYDGVPINVIRGSKRVFIQDPYISIGGAMVPDFLEELAKNKRHKSGFMFRLLYTFPDSRPKVSLRDMKPVPTEVKEQYLNIINRLYELDFNRDLSDGSTPGPHVIRFNKHAMDSLYAWDDVKTAQINALKNPKERALRKSIYARLNMNFIRIAGVLECLKYACGYSDLSQVTADTAQCALSLAEYYETQLIKIYEHLEGISAADGGQYNINWKTLFAGAPQLSTGEIKKRAEAKYGISPRAMHDYIKHAEHIGKLVHLTRTNRSSLYRLGQ